MKNKIKIGITGLGGFGIVCSHALHMSDKAEIIAIQTRNKEKIKKYLLSQNRCIVIADGYYEWEKKAGGRQAWYFHRQDKQPFALAGLWESWQATEQDQPLLSGTILTTTANELSRPVHDRMPVILAEDDYASWLDPDNQGQDSVRALLAPCPDMLFTRIPVSSHVNSPRHDDQRCILEVPTERELF